MSTVGAVEKDEDGRRYKDLSCEDGANELK